MPLQKIFDRLTTPNWNEIAGILFLEKMPISILSEQLIKLLEIPLPEDFTSRHALLKFAIFQISSKASQINVADQSLIIAEFETTDLEATSFTKPELQILLRDVKTEYASGKASITAPRKIQFNTLNQLELKKHEEVDFYTLPVELIRILWDTRNNEIISKKLSIPSLARAHVTLLQKLCSVFNFTKQHWTKIGYLSPISKKPLRLEKKYVLSDPSIRIDKSRLITFTSDDGMISLPTEHQLNEIGISHVKRP